MIFGQLDAIVVHFQSIFSLFTAQFPVPHHSNESIPVVLAERDRLQFNGWRVVLVVVHVAAGKVVGAIIVVFKISVILVGRVLGSIRRKGGEEASCECGAAVP